VTENFEEVARALNEGNALPLEHEREALQ
jgi:hypothetical protein